MTIYRRHGVWHVDFRFTDPLTGLRRRCRRSTGPGTTKKEATELAHRLKIQLETPPAPPEPVRKQAAFSGFAKHWYDLHFMTNCKPSYARTTEQILRVHLVPFFGGQDLRELTVEQVESYKALKARTLSPKTVNNHLGVLGRMLRSAVDWGYADHNLARQVQPLRVPPSELNFWDREQSDVFLARALEREPAWHPFFLTALRTGMRLGELFALEWRSLDFIKRRIHVQRSYTRGVLGTPKSGKGRRVPMSRELAEALRDHRHLKGRLVFCRPDGGYLSRDIVKHPFRRLTAAAGLPAIRLHDLRHSFASQLVMEGVPLRAVQKFLGHSTLDMTMRYAHLSPEAEQDYVSRLDSGEVRSRSGHVRGVFNPADSATH